MKKYNFIVFVMAICIISACSAQTTKALVYGPDKSIAQNSPSEITIEADPGKFTNNGNRAEAYIENTGMAKHYEFSFFPRQYTDEKDWFLFAEWRQPASVLTKAKNNNVLYGPLHLSLVNGYIVFTDAANKFIGPITNLRERTDVNYSLFKTPLLLNKWNSISLDVIWTDQFSGNIIITINGTKRVFNNVRTLYDSSAPIGFKFGIYRSPRHVKKAIFDFKNVKINNSLVSINTQQKLKITPNNSQKIQKSLKSKRIYQK